MTLKLKGGSDVKSEVTRALIKRAARALHLPEPGLGPSAAIGLPGCSHKLASS